MLANTLFSSWLRVVGIWWIIAAVYWAFSNDWISQTFQLIPKELFQFGPGPCELPGVACDADGKPQVNALNALKVALYNIGYWTGPTITIVFACSGIGAVAAGVTRAMKFRREENQLKSDGVFRGVHISLGKLIHPQWEITDVQPIKVKMDKSIAPKFKSLEERHERLFGEILDFLRQHPEAFVGDGHEGTLLDHTLGVVEQAVEAVPDDDKPMDPLLPIVAAAHDIGKIRSWAKTETGEWYRRQGVAGDHDTQGGLLLSGMPGFMGLTPEERQITLYLTKYGHKPWMVPLTEKSVADRLKELQSALKMADEQQTAQEKQSVLQNIDSKEGLEAVFYQAFTEVLTSAKFQVPGAIKGVAAMGWRKDDLVVLIEIPFREAMAKALPDEVVAAVGGSQRIRNSLSGLTKRMIDWFDDKGWLVKEVDVYPKPEDEKPLKSLRCPEGHHAVWNMYSGTKRFDGVIGLRLPEEELRKLPGNTAYELKFSGLMYEPKRTSKAKDSIDPELKRRGEGITKRKRAEKAGKKAFQQRLEQQSDDIKDAFAKAKRRYSTLPGTIPDDKILDSVLERHTSSAKKADETSSVELGSEPNKSEVPAYSDTQKKKARTLMRDALNAGKAMSMSDALKAVSGGVENVDGVAGQRVNYRDKEVKMIGGIQPALTKPPFPNRAIKNATAQLDDNQRKQMNQLRSWALNSGVAMTGDEAATAVLQGLYQGAQCADEGDQGSNNSSKSSAKGQKTAKTKPQAKKPTQTQEGAWEILSKEQRREVNKRMTAALNAGEVPDKQAIAREVADAGLSGNHKDWEPSADKASVQATESTSSSLRYEPLGEANVHEHDILSQFFPRAVTAKFTARPSRQNTTPDSVSELDGSPVIPQENGDIPDTPKKKRRRRRKRKKTSGQGETATKANSSSDTVSPKTETEVDSKVPQHSDATHPEKAMAAPEPHNMVEHETPFTHTQVLPSPEAPIEAGKGRISAVPILDSLTPEEARRLRKEFQAALNAGKTGIHINRVAIAEKIISERTHDVEQQPESKR